MGAKCEIGVVGAGMMGAEIALCFAMPNQRVGHEGNYPEVGPDR